MVKSDIESTIVQSSVTLPPILFAAFAEMPGTWLETAQTANAGRIGEMTNLYLRPVVVDPVDALVVATLLIENMR